MSKTKRPINEFYVPTLLQMVAGHYEDYGVIFDSDNICIARDKRAGFQGRHPLNEPFRLKANHLLLFKSGRATYVCNLKKTEIGAGTVLAMSENTIYSITSLSPDCKFDAVVFSPAVLQEAMPRTPFNIFGTQRKSYAFVPSEQDRVLLQGGFDSLVKVCLSDTFSRRSQFLALRTLISMTDDVWIKMGATNLSGLQGNDERIFNSFLDLVNTEFRSHRDLAYYADKLCISVNHLSTTVSTFSGIPPKQWIEQAVISEAKVQLCYSGQNVTQIADELNFPSVSFFCKYFQRIVGLTPKKYAASMEKV
ncbi:MAG: helix-turn-helix domain-containing protein [Prevotella sp.]|jgi:AraC family transcriptional activator of pobA